MGLVVFNFVGKETQQASTNAQNAIFIDSSLLKHSYECSCYSLTLSELGAIVKILSTIIHIHEV